jgi:hypothetical protein
LWSELKYFSFLFFGWFRLDIVGDMITIFAPNKIKCFNLKEIQFREVSEFRPAVIALQFSPYWTSFVSQNIKLPKGSPQKQKKKQIEDFDFDFFLLFLNNSVQTVYFILPTRCDSTLLSK